MAQDLSDDVFMVVRPRTGTAARLAPEVRAAVSRVDTEQLVSVRDIRTLDEIERTVTAWHRFRAVLVGAFAALALALAMVGVFGILGYSVQQQVRDFGVRRALGATTGDILRLVTVNAARVVVTGAAAGLALAALAGRLIEKMLFGVRPLDPVTFVIVAIVARRHGRRRDRRARLARDAHRSSEGAPEPMRSRRNLRGAVTAA